MVMSERLGWTGTVLVSTFVLGTVVWKVSSSRSEDNWVGHALARFRQKPRPTGSAAGNGAVLPCITARRSIFARHFIDRRIDASIVQTLLEAAMWAPFHGPVPPWRFVVLGRESMVEMQKLTLEFYEANWRDVFSGDDERYRKLRVKLERAATDKWGPVSFMIAIVMQRQAGSKRMPEWEEMSATAAAVQNMHIQAGAVAGLACYWTSWQPDARDSAEMKAYLNMSAEDKLLGFFIVAAYDPDLKDSRKRDPAKHLAAEWRA